MEMERHSTSPPCGNLVDGLPHDCHTETIAKLARLGPAKNDTTLEKSSSYRCFALSCPECIEDLDECLKMLERQCHGQIHDISGFEEIPEK